MKRKPIIWSLLLPVTMAFAQSSLQNSINDYTQRIDSIVTAEKAKMNSEMDMVDARFENGTIDAGEKIKQKKEIAGRYEKIINEKVDAEKNKLDEITRTAAVNSVFRKPSDTLKDENNVRVFSNNRAVVVLKKSNDGNPESYLRSSDLVVSYGFLNLTQDKGSFNPFEDRSEMRIGNSHSFEIQARHERQIGSYTSPFFVRYGLAYRSDTYMPKKSKVFAEGEDMLYLENFADGRLKRSKFRNIYLTFPVEVQWTLNPEYTEYNGKRYLDGRKKQWRIGAGAYVGINTRSIVKVKYHNEEDKFRKYKNVVDEGVNPLLFGVKFGVSYGNLNFFLKKDLTPVFNDKAVLPAKNGIQIGIDIANIGF